MSAPIGWDELDDPALRPDGITIRDMPTGWPSAATCSATVLDGDQTLPEIS